MLQFHSTLPGPRKGIAESILRPLVRADYGKARRGGTPYEMERIGDLFSHSAKARWPKLTSGGFPIEGIDFLGADVPQEENRAVRGEATPWHSYAPHCPAEPF